MSANSASSSDDKLDAVEAATLIRLNGFQRTLKDAVKIQDIPVIVTLASPPFVIYHINELWCRLCGYTESEARVPGAVVERGERPKPRPKQGKASYGGAERFTLLSDESAL
ncbi:hypothetical protein EMIHUDRAFT_224908 [Emiliania huxleyi CCMP1516]|uniref:PAS domain-containing protein n=2 Tax=Emiliania huxleyi TaxID=2903 RepID=A0A0D3KQ88_EMIH1|nr:hypothetical protein EMIHUDRAFT_224908 [Emiliania huxleyi CCMP1516]EOD37923.1 hypothetical protein EMIHUDRAFT_224908 [Emiliania huxleyi CCMP1516]|eukprot:XP_005790352.1 hypothetical protein EMIHUDRAFT_224908 [Emiliania huxleyi CCMP1516]